MFMAQPVSQYVYIQVSWTIQLVHQLMRLVEGIQGARCRNEQTVSCYLDSVWHDGLLLKLREIHHPGRCPRMIARILMEVASCIRTGGYVSFERRVTSGLPQSDLIKYIALYDYVSDKRRKP